MKLGMLTACLPQWSLERIAELGRGRRLRSARGRGVAIDRRP